MIQFLRKQPPARIIVLGFLATILIGTLLLMLPFSIKPGQTLGFLNALFTSTSAVCVTGLVVVDTFDTFTLFGQIVICLLIQIGGLGVTAIGAGIIIAMGKKMNLKGRNLVRESLNISSSRGAVRFIRSIFLTTIIIEGVGALLSFFVFMFYPIEGVHFTVGQAIWTSIFHSVASFNNAGFDILGGFKNLADYTKCISLNLITALLIFFGGIGFLVIRELFIKKFNIKRLSMQAKTVFSVSFFLIISGMLLLKLTERSNISWLGAFFTSVSTRTAGFSTFGIGNFSTAGLLVMIILMFIGASPGSTGGGIKTTSIFVIFQGIKSAATNKQEKAFRYSIPQDAFKKAAVIASLAISVILVGTFTLVICQPSDFTFIDALFEVTSAFGTVGLSTGITSKLLPICKSVIILIMFIGRLGPLTIASLWYFSRGERVSFPEGNISIG